MPSPVPWQVSGISGTILSSYLFVASCARLCVREERGNVACYRPLCIVLPRCACLCKAKGRGPTAALKRLANNAWSGEAGICQAEAKRAWVDKARTASLLGSCPDSHKSFNSGTKAWAAFACEALQLKGKEFPPPLDGLLAWSALFRHHKTFSNYLGYVRLGCHVLGVSDEVFRSPELKRAKVAVRKNGGFNARARMFLGHEMIRRIVALANPSSAVEWSLAMMFLATYIFLLRLPSEALPMTVGGIGCGQGRQSVISLESDELCLRLAKRKNLPSGSVIRRTCWCSFCVITCPVHTLWKFCEEQGKGAQPFVEFKDGFALRSLRCILKRLSVPEAGVYRTHDIRRGHAQDLLVRGASLAEILRAGQWKSPAFLVYLDLETLEKGAVVEAHRDESSSDDED